MFKVPTGIIVVGALAWVFTDIDSQSVFSSVLLPLLVFLSIVAFAIWLALFIHKTGLDKDEGIQNVESNAPIAPDDIGGFGDGGNGGC
jgi:cation transporter-like permease